MDEVVDGVGRRITLRRMGLLETLRLCKALGPDLSVNKVYMGYAVLASSVAMIDDIPVPFPTSEAAVEALIERLGNDGAAAVAAATQAPPREKVLADAGN